VLGEHLESDHEVGLLLSRQVHLACKSHLMSNFAHHTWRT
jgi:hypothetical protein